MTAAARPLEGRVALVTGAARNIGRAIAIALSEAGSQVAASDSAQSPDLDETAQLARAHAFAVDLSDPTGPEGLVRTAHSAFGRLDIVVNNAAFRPHTPFGSLSFDDWRAVMAVNLDAAFLTAKAACAALCHSDAGRLINVSGLSARIGAAHRAHVIAAKSGLEGLTRALAVELAPHGGAANAVSPGQIATQRTNGVGHPDFGGRAPLTQSPGTPEDVAATARHLAGPDGRYVTCQAPHVGGGLYMGA